MSYSENLISILKQILVWSGSGGDESQRKTQHQMIAFG